MLLGLMLVFQVTLQQDQKFWEVNFGERFILSNV